MADADGQRLKIFLSGLYIRPSVYHWPEAISINIHESFADMVEVYNGMKDTKIVKLFQLKIATKCYYIFSLVTY